MAPRLTANLGNETTAIPLRHEILRLGSDQHCELRIEHEEVQPHALTLDFRGNALLLQNHNPYDIYLGDQAVSTGAWCPWNPHTPLRMTRSLTLTYEADGAAIATNRDTTPTAETEEPPALSTRKMVQIGVICTCAIVGLLVWNIEPSPTAASNTQQDFQTLISSIDNSLIAHKSTDEAELLELRRLLQEARLSELRWKTSDPERVIAAHQRLLNRDKVRTAREVKADEKNDLLKLYSELYQYASQKKARIDQK